MHDEQAKKPVGRPALKQGKAKSDLLRMRVQPREKATYERAAKAQGVDVSTWARDVLNRAVKEPPSHER